MNGIVENEICPVLVTVTRDEPQPNPEEVADVRWISWPDWVVQIKTAATGYSKWCGEQTLLLQSDYLDAIRGCGIHLA